MRANFKRNILLTALALMACRAGAATVLEETIEKTYPVSADSKVSIRNVDGAIWIYGANVTEMRVQAIKKAYSQERLNEISVNISVTNGEIAIDTKLPPRPKWGLSDRSGTVEYTVILPWTCRIARAELATGELLIEGMRGAETRASLANGRMFAHDCFTNLHLEVANGGLDVLNEWWEQQPFSLNADVVNGNVRVFVPGEASFHAKASSVNGKVACDFIEKEDREPGGASHIDFAMGDPTDNEINIRSVNGSIRIAEANP